jgi:hypothetical protein
VVASCNCATFCLIGHTSTSSQSIWRERVVSAPTRGRARLDGMEGLDRTPGSRDEQAVRRRSALSWPDPVRSGPGRWTIVLSAVLVVALGGAALAVILVRM